MTSSISILSPALNLFEGQLEIFAASPEYQSSLILAFGESHDYTTLQPILSGLGTNVLSLIEIVPLATLNGAYGAFSRDTNKIYLASEFINSATPSAIADILLEEYGHYIDAQLNSVETVGDEGEIFADLVQGNPVNPAAFTEDDTNLINVAGNWITVENVDPIILNVNTTLDQNDGSADNGLSLRDALMIANSDSNPNNYEIILTGGATYQLTALNLSSDTDRGGDLDIYGDGQVTIRTNDNQRATIDASLLTSDRAIQSGYRQSSISVIPGYLVLENIVITGGSTSGLQSGGGIDIDGNSVGIFRNIIVSDNSSSNGGGIANNGTVILVDSSVINNELSGGTSLDGGGGIYNTGTLTILNSTIQNNEGNVYGGGIDSFRPTTIVNSTISNNTAGNGAGIRIIGDSLGLNNVTISGNTASSNGGGIYVSVDSVVNLVNTTMTNNTASDRGGGIYILSSGATINLKNTIVAGNDSPNIDNIERSSLADNAIINDDGSNLIDIDPQLGPLQNNGGITLTHAPLAGSPAIDLGRNSNISVDSIDMDRDGDTTELSPTDQRGSGYSRIYGNSVDIGAFEVQPGPPTISINNATATDDLANSNAIFTVTLSSASSLPITLTYFTFPATAIQDIDYTSVTGTLTFNPGETTAFISVPILQDTVYEPDEGFLVTLVNPTNANLGLSVGAGTITNIDAAQYGASNPDLIQAFGYNLDAFRQHYYNSGSLESRSADNFDEYRYIASNFDLISAFGLNGAGATYHYITSGYSEGRSLTNFIPSRYLNSYSDLYNAFGTNLSAATQHYITNGFSEQRNPNLFLADRYIASYTDLIQTFRYNLEAGSNHYLFSGLNEGRGITFDPYSYVGLNPDVGAAYNYDPTLATQHYILYGFDEGRPIA